jgi:carbon monoxide dehydrogenase subunit G
VELTHDFEVGVPVDEAWNVLTDVERIAPCLPGAQLQEVEGDEYRGVVKVKVGPISAQYKGKAAFAERDEAGRRAVLQASGRETRGQGNASATITAELSSSGDVTRVHLVTDLSISGKVAQFGRGALADVSQKLLGQFVDNLEATVLTASPPEAAEPGMGSAVEATDSVPSSRRGDGEPAAVRGLDQPEADPIDLLDAAGAPVAKRALPLLGIVAVVLVVLVLRGRRRRRR